MKQTIVSTIRGTGSKTIQVAQPPASSDLRRSNPQGLLLLPLLVSLLFSTASSIARDQVPIKGEEIAIAHYFEPQEDGTILLGGTADGICSHVGQFTGVWDHHLRIDIVGDRLAFVHYDAVFVMKAANGDELHFDYQGVTEFDFSHHEGTATVIKGTGRFEGTQGVLHFTGVPAMDYFEFQGVISTVGSVRGRH